MTFVIIANLVAVLTCLGVLAALMHFAHGVAGRVPAKQRFARSQPETVAELEQAA